MDCHQAQADIALWVGNDLDMARVETLRQHVQSCPACQSTHTRMQQTFELLDASLTDSGSTSHCDSIWPDVSLRLSAIAGKPSTADFPTWIPASLATALAAMLVLMLTAPSNQTSTVNPDDGWADASRYSSGYSLHPVHEPSAKRMGLSATRPTLISDPPKVWNDFPAPVENGTPRLRDPFSPFGNPLPTQGWPSHPPRRDVHLLNMQPPIVIQ